MQAGQSHFEAMGRCGISPLETGFVILSKCQAGKYAEIDDGQSNSGMD